MIHEFFEMTLKAGDIFPVSIYYPATLSRRGCQRSQLVDVIHEFFEMTLKKPDFFAVCYSAGVGSWSYQILKISLSPSMNRV